MIQYPVLLIDGEIADFYDLSLHDALPISRALLRHRMRFSRCAADGRAARAGRRRGASLDADRGGLSGAGEDRKSTRLNSSHVEISYAAFCLKKKMSNSGITIAHSKQSGVS